MKTCRGCGIQPRIWRALTLWQPWATAIAKGLKRVENRQWSPPADAIGRTIAIHAGKVWDGEGAEFLSALGVQLGRAECPSSAIVGLATIDRVIAHASARGTHKIDLFTALPPDPIHADPMFFGPWGWVLRDIERVDPPIHHRGAQGLWRLTAEAEHELILRRKAA